VFASSKILTWPGFTRFTTFAPDHHASLGELINRMRN
jgi:hypothetical protein